MAPHHPDLGPAEREELRQILETERAVLQRSLARARRDGPVTLDQQAVGRLSRMDALMNEGLQQGSMARAGEELGLVEAALERLATGTYGFCQSCATPIARNRLLAIPETLTCARCRV